jgi:hypothetical protein
LKSKINSLKTANPPTLFSLHPTVDYLTDTLEKGKNELSNIKNGKKLAECKELEIEIRIFYLETQRRKKVRTKL